MDTTVTVRIRSLVLAGVVALALVAAYLVGTTRGGGEAAQAETQAAAAGVPVADRPSVVMDGRGTATVVPDEAAFDVQVSLRRDDLSQALRDASRAMSRVFDALAEQGVAKSDVQTSGLSMRPEYQHHDDAPPTLLGYRVTQSADVVVRDLKNAGRAITAAVEAGDDDAVVERIRLQVSDTTAAMARARTDAVREATAKAEAYAEATGQTLGAVLSVQELSEPQPWQETTMSASDAMYDAQSFKANMPIRAGEDDLTVDVRVVWSIG